MGAQISTGALQTCGALFSRLFGSGYDGAAASAGLIYASGSLYGATNGGGPYFSGTAFALTLAPGRADR